MEVPNTVFWAITVPAVGLVWWAVKILARTGVKRLKELMGNLWLTVSKQWADDPEIKAAFQKEMKQLALECIRMIGWLRQKIKNFKCGKRVKPAREIEVLSEKTISSALSERTQLEFCFENADLKKEAR